MGSDLYLSISVGNEENDGWHDLFEGPSDALERGALVDAFGDCDPDRVAAMPGHLSPVAFKQMQEHPECPWRLDEPYWVRLVSGQEFCAIVRERRWMTLQDGDWSDLEVSEETRAFVAAVESLLAEGRRVRVWLWHSQ